MVTTSNITLIISSTTLTDIFDTYLVDASAGSIILTLPNIICDGIQYKIRRIDNSNNTVTLQGFSGSQPINGLSSVLIEATKSISVVSFGIDSGDSDGEWYTVIVPELELECYYYNSYSSISQPIPNTTGTPITVNFNTLRSESNSSDFTNSSGQITINNTNTYAITYNVTTNNTSNQRGIARSFLELNTGSGFTLIPGSNSYAYNRTSSEGENTVGVTIIHDLNAGDIIRVRVEKFNTTSSSLETVANASNLTLHTICGARGPPGMVFGSEFIDANSDVQSTTTSTTYQIKLSLALPLVPSGKYRIGYTYEVSIIPNEELMEVRTILDPSGIATILSNTLFEADNDYHTMGGFAYITNFTGGVNVQIQYRVRPGDSGTAAIRRARLEFWRIS